MYNIKNSNILRARIEAIVQVYDTTKDKKVYKVTDVQVKNSVTLTVLGVNGTTRGITETTILYLKVDHTRTYMFW